MYTALLIEDDALIADALTCSLEQEDVMVFRARSLQHALNALQRLSFDVVICGRSERGGALILLGMAAFL